MRRKKNILLTGIPGIGKTTLIKKIADQVNELHPVGFYTAEIRERGLRKGFELISLAGRTGLLSHTGIKSPFRVGKYGVDLKGFEEFLASLSLPDSAKVVVIDEIGKMECFSEKFRTLITGILDSDRLLIATVSLKGSGFIAEIKKRDDVKLIEISEENRDSLVPVILKEMKNTFPHL
jgi:nucleoside-triphosphatase